MRARRVLRVDCIVAAFLFAGCGVCASPSYADDDATSALLRQGVELRRQHRNEEALAAYEQAFALSPTAAVRAQRGLAEQALGHWTAAERDLDLALAASDPWVARNRASLEDARVVVHQHLSWLTVDVDVAGAAIQLDGEPLTPGSEARVLAGVGVVEVRAAGYVPEIRRVSLAPSEHVRQRITLAPLLAPALTSEPSPASAAPTPAVREPAALVQPEAIHAPPPSPPRAGGVSPLIPAALGVLGVAGIATGTYFGIRTFQHRSDERRDCVGQCTAASTNDYQDGQTSATVSNVAFGAGAALVAGGALVWLLGRRHEPGHDLKLAPAVGTGMNGLVLSGSL